MDKNQTLKLASAIFAIIALAHLVRAVLNLPVSIATFDVPVYFSYVVVIVAGYLAWLMHNAEK